MALMANSNSLAEIRFPGRLSLYQRFFNDIYVRALGWPQHRMNTISDLIFRHNTGPMHGGIIVLEYELPSRKMFTNNGPKVFIKNGNVLLRVYITICDSQRFYTIVSNTAPNQQTDLWRGGSSETTR